MIEAIRFLKFKNSSKFNINKIKDIKNAKYY